MKILVVDDERWIRKGIVKMIQKEALGIDEILEADGVDTGWQVFNENHPALILSDVKFPIDNGCVLCEKIFSACPSTKIIMLSGYGEFEYVKAALQYKAMDYLLKPVDKGVLNAAIELAIKEIRNEERAARPVQANEKVEKKKSTTLKSEELIKAVMADIEENFDQKISLNEMALKYYINETYLSNLFTKIAGLSLVNYHMKIRIEKAQTLLMITKLSITDIAMKVGYENARYFTRVFKKVTGETPKEYRVRLERELHEED